MENALLNDPTAHPTLRGTGSNGRDAGMSLADAAAKGVLTAGESSTFVADGKYYPMYQVGLAAFSTDGPKSMLMFAIQQMLQNGILRAWTGGKVELTNAEIGKKSPAEAATAVRSGPLLVLKEWDEMSPRDHELYRTDPRHWYLQLGHRLSGEYRFEVADVGLQLPYLVALRHPTDAEMAGTPASWYADREAKQEAEREVTIDPTGGREGVTVYSEAGGKGKSRHFFAGRYNIDDLRKCGIGNDVIASVSVGRRHNITLYADSDYSGTSETIQGGTSAFQSTQRDLSAGLAKGVSSLVVTDLRGSDTSGQHQITTGTAGSSTGYTLLSSGRFG
ncbi:hypothetical protein ABZ479_23855 [Streptomyces sp. NPDC005722]